MLMSAGKNDPLLKELPKQIMRTDFSRSTARRFQVPRQRDRSRDLSPVRHGHARYFLLREIPFGEDGIFPWNACKAAMTRSG